MVAKPAFNWSFGLAATLLLAFPSLATAVEESIETSFRNYSLKASLIGGSKSAIAGPSGPIIVAPSGNAAKFQGTEPVKTMTLPENPSLVSEILGTHELSFGSSTMRALGLRNSDRNSEGELYFSSVKLRASKNGVAMKATFTFK